MGRFYCAGGISLSEYTVAEVLKEASVHTVSWPLPEGITEGNLREIPFPNKQNVTNRKIPAREYLYKELARSGVTLSLLWNEYCETCRLNDDIPFMYSQFCRYYRKYARTTKATMSSPGLYLMRTSLFWMRHKHDTSC